MFITFNVFADDRVELAKALRKNAAVIGAVKEAERITGARACGTLQFVQLTKTAFRVRMDCSKSGKSVQLEILGAILNQDYDLQLARIVFTY